MATMELAWDGQRYTTTPMDDRDHQTLQSQISKTADVLNALRDLARPRPGCVDRHDIQAIIDAMTPAYDLLVALEERRRWKMAGDAAAARLEKIEAEFPEATLED